MILALFWKIYFIRKLILQRLYKKIDNNRFLNKKEKGIIFYQIKKALIKKSKFKDFTDFFCSAYFQNKNYNIIKNFLKHNNKIN